MLLAILLLLSAVDFLEGGGGRLKPFIIGDSTAQNNADFSSLPLIKLLPFKFHIQPSLHI